MWWLVKVHAWLLIWTGFVAEMSLGLRTSASLVYTPPFSRKSVPVTSAMLLILPLLWLLAWSRRLPSLSALLNGVTTRIKMHQLNVVNTSSG